MPSLTYTPARYTSDGTQRDYAFGFPYIHRDHVFVYIDGILTIDWTWLNDNTIRLDQPAVEGAEVSIERRTPRSERLVNFNNVSMLKQDVLNKDSNQLFYILQEMRFENEIPGMLDAANIFGLIPGTQIEPGTLEGTMLVPGTIDGGDIIEGTVTANAIAANAILAVHIAAGVIQAGHIASGSINAGHLSAGSVTADAIAANAIQAAHISAGAINAGHIAANTIQASHIAVGAVDVTKLAAGTLSADNITAGIINATIGLSAANITGGTLNIGNRFLVASDGTVEILNAQGRVILRSGTGINAAELYNRSAGSIYYSAPIASPALFTRNSQAFDEAGTTVYHNVPRFVIGQNGLAVVAEGGTTNQFPYTSMSLLRSYYTSAVTGTVLSDGFYRANRLNASLPLANIYSTGYGLALTSGQPMALSCRVRLETGKTISDYFIGGVPKLRIYKSDGSINTFINCSVISRGNNLYDIYGIYTAGTTTTNIREFDLSNFNSASGTWTSIDVGRIQVEYNRNYPLSWQNPYGGARGADRLRYANTGGIILNPTAGTVEVTAYIDPSFGVGSRNRTLFAAIKETTPYNRRIGLYHNNVGAPLNTWTLVVGNGTAAQSLQVNNTLSQGHHTFKVAWDSAEMSLWIDGVKVGSIPNPPLPLSDIAENFCVGAWWDGNSTLDSNISQVRVSNIARHAAELAVNDGQKFKVDEHTTFYCHYNGVIEAVGGRTSSLQDWAPSGRGTNVCNPRYSTWEEAALPPLSASAGAACTQDATQAFFGTKSLKVVSSTADAFVYLGSSTTDYNIKITPGKKWLLSGYVRGDFLGGSGDATATVKTNDGVFTPATAAPWRLNQPNTWQRFVLPIDLSASSANSCLIRLANAGGSGGTMWFDGIMLEEAAGYTTPSAYAIPAGEVGVAYQHGADITSQNTAAGIANQGAFATLDQIDGDNIETYIADLSVDTLQIKGQAVTVPVYSYTSNSLDLNGQNTQVQSATIVTSGGSVYVHFSTHLKHSDNFLGLAGDWTVTLKRDGVTLYSKLGFQSWLGDEFGTYWLEPLGDFAFSLAIVDIPAAGTHTYTLWVEGPGNGSYAENRSIFLLEVKR